MTNNKLNQLANVFGRPSKYTTETTDKAVLLFLGGSTASEVAKATGISYSDAQYYKRKAEKISLDKSLVNAWKRKSRTGSSTTQLVAANDLPSAEQALLTQFDHELKALEEALAAKKARREQLAAILVGPGIHSTVAKKG